MPLGIQIPGTGPGTGPIIPPPLPSLGGVDDYKHRYSNARLDGAAGDLFTFWEDSVANPEPFSYGGTAYQIAETSGAKYLRKVPGVSGSFSGPLMPYTAPGTVVMIASCDPGNTVGGTRYIANALGFQLGRAGNNAWQASGAGGFATAGTGDAFEFFAFGHDGSAPTFVSGDIVVQRGASRSSSLSNTVTPVSNGQFQVTGISTLEFGIAEIVLYDRKLSNTELDAVRAAMMAYSPLF